MRLPALSFAVAAVLLVACGGSSDDPPLSSGSAGSAGSGTAGTGTAGTGTGGATAGSAGTAGGGVDPATACAAIASATCKKKDACRDGEATRQFGTLDECIDRTRTACVAALAAPDTGATPASTAECAAATDAAGCPAWLAEAPVAGCGPKAGKRADGAACTYPAQCQSAFCATMQGATCGACAPMPKAGDTCGNGVGCGATDLRCDNGTSTCVLPLALGASCPKGAPCAEGASCVGATKDAPGTCTADAATVGAACDPKTDTGPSCDKNLGLACDKTAKTCAKILLADPGAPCGALGDGVAVCSKKSACAIPAGMKSGVCVADAADGGACDTVSGPFCEAPARCVVATGTTGTCKLPDASACP